jgi:ABC-type phosphate transport system ATPase subunit
MLVSESIPADLLSDIRTNTKYLFQTTYQASTIIEQKADLYLKNLLNRTLFESGLFRESEDHIMTTNIEALSGGQQARLLTAYYLTGPEQVVILDEGLERTTQRFSTSGVYTRERLIRFIGNIAESSGKTILLIVQGGSNEQQLVHKFAGDYYLGCLKISNKSVSYCTDNQ